MTVHVASAGASSDLGRRLRGKVDRYITPVVLLILAASALAVWVLADFDATTADILQPDKLLRQARQHVVLTFWSTLLVMSIAIPIGILVTRPRYKRLAPPILAVANAGQAVPAYGLLCWSCSSPSWARARERLSWPWCSTGSCRSCATPWSAWSRSTAR